MRVDRVGESTVSIEVEQEPQRLKKKEKKGILLCSVFMLVKVHRCPAVNFNELMIQCSDSPQRSMTS